MSTYYGEFLLSKVIEENDATQLIKYGVTQSDFVTEGEKQVYAFIMDYASKNHNHCPDYRTITAEFENFTFRPNITDGYEYLVTNLKQYVTSIRIQEFMENKAMKKFEEVGGLDFGKWMQEELDYIVKKADYRTKIGTDLTLDINDFLAEYDNRKLGKSFKVWKSAFPSMPDYTGGNTYAWFARSGRGKSFMASCVEACHSAMQGATVLIWAMEMPKFELLSRMYTYISGTRRMVEQINKEESVMAGFDANEIMNGKLSTDDEAGFRTFMRHLNSEISGKIIIRAVDDMDFYNRSASELEKDILQTKADIVVIDPIYYMDMESNSSKVSGGDVANTSKKLRRIAGTYKVVMHIITQADEVKDDRDENGKRELKVPVRAEVKKTKAILEDASLLIGLDTCDGAFRIELGKGRQGGEGDIIEGIYLPRIGLVYEPQMEEYSKMASEFGF